MALYDSHPEHRLLREGSQLVIAGVCASSGRTLHAYSNMSCLMQYEAPEEMEDGTAASD